jgi:hypothetical protein
MLTNDRSQRPEPAAADVRFVCGVTGWLRFAALVCSLIQFSFGPHPNHPQDQHTDGYKRVCAPVNPTVHTIKLAWADCPEFPLPVEWMACNEQEQYAHKSCSQSYGIKGGHVGCLQPHNHRQQDGKQN